MSEKTDTVEPKKPTQTIGDLRQVLLESIDRIVADKAPAANVNAITNAAGKVISTWKLQLEVMKLTNQKPTTDFMQIADAK